MELKDTLNLERLDIALDAMKKSLEVISQIYKKGFEIQIKNDDSPVTDADLASDKVIRDTIVSKYPDDGYLSEEEADSLERLSKEYTWIVDPLDGTEDFVHRDGMFCVNLALCHNHEIVIGLVGVPMTGEIFFAVKGKGTYLLSSNGYKKQLHVSSKTDNMKAVTSVYHSGEEEMKVYSNPLIKDVLKLGSSLKACAIASGEAEFALKLGPGTKEWDTAAPQLIVEEAGGVYLKPNLDKIIYNRVDVYNREGYVMANDYQTAYKLLNK